MSHLGSHPTSSRAWSGKISGQIFSLLLMLCLPFMCSWFDNLFGGGGALHHSAGGGDVLVHHPQVWLSILFPSLPVAQAGREGDSVVVCGACASPWQCAWWYMRMVFYANVQDAGAHRGGGRGGAGGGVSPPQRPACALSGVFFCYLTCWSCIDVECCRARPCSM